jgi:hypothetical protein
MNFFKIVIFLSLISLKNGSDPMTLIYNDIMSGLAPTTVQDYSLISTKTPYNSQIMPPAGSYLAFNRDSNGALPVNIQLSLRQIVSFDEKNQILTTNIYIYLFWSDPRLSWNPANYSDVQMIHIQANKIWWPDLSIMNAAGTTNMISIVSNQYLAIDFNGFVTIALNWPSLQTRCPLDVKKYPFDTQKCSIIIGSWMYTTKEINLAFYDYWNLLDEEKLQANGITYKKMIPQYSDISNYVNHPYWDLKSMTDSFVIDPSRYLMFNEWNWELELE